MSRTSSRRRPSASRPKPVFKKPALTRPAANSSQLKSKVPGTPARWHEIVTKRRGELAELAFAYKATSLGFGVSKPFGDSEHYDAIIDARPLAPEKTRGPERSTSIRKAKANRRPQSKACPGQAQRAEWDPAFSGTAPGPETNHHLRPPLWRVQIKCTTYLLEGLYHLAAQRNIGGHTVPYLPGEFDFLAAYIVPEDTWYIIPFEALRGRSSLLFRRHDDPKPSRYDPYKEAWHLLRPETTICPHGFACHGRPPGCTPRTASSRPK